MSNNLRFRILKFEREFTEEIVFPSALCGETPIFQIVFSMLGKILTRSPSIINFDHCSNELCSSSVVTCITPCFIFTVSKEITVLLSYILEMKNSAIFKRKNVLNTFQEENGLRSPDTDTINFRNDGTLKGGEAEVFELFPR